MGSAVGDSGDENEEGKNMAEQKVTIKDVAREAGVSISTVSNALNGVDVLRPDTRRHILEVAERMNYVPNLNGRNLKSQFTKVIGLFLTSIKGTYYNVLVDSVYQECRKYGYELNIFVSERAENMMSNMRRKRSRLRFLLTGLLLSMTAVSAAIGMPMCWRQVCTAFMQGKMCGIRRKCR